MAREFAVTTATPSLRVAPSDKGEIAFTVSNMSGVRLRARATLRPEEGTRLEWLSLRGERYRDMPPDATEVFMVDVRVPPGAPQGSYRFTLLVMDEANPDERYVIGPTVVLDVPAAAVVPKRDWRPWLVLAAGILVVLGGATAAFLALRSKDSGTGGSGPPPAKLGEACAGKTCATGLSCGPQSVCLGAAGFSGCQRSADCVTGLCAQGTCTACPSPGLICGDRCVSPATDQENCGGCGRKCVLGAVCTNGSCLRVGIRPEPRPPTRLSPNPTQTTQPRTPLLPPSKQ